MNEFQEFSHTGTPGTPRWVGLAVGVLGALSLIGWGLGWSALNQAKSLEQTAVASKQAGDALSQRLAKEDEINQQLQSDLKVIADKLNVTQGELVTARKQNKTATHAVDQKVDSLASSMKVGSIQLVLKDTNPKKNQYTMNVLADDNSFEKKNRSVNEPIFFYTGGGRFALELVVNKVTKAGATGYLSIPKGAPTATASVATSGQ